MKLLKTHFAFSLILSHAFPKSDHILCFALTDALK